MLLLVALGTACNMAGSAGAPYPAGLSDQMIDVGGVARQFRVHVPAGLSTPRAVVFVLHGGGGEGLGVANLGSHPLSVFRTVADREGFAVVYPGGLSANDATARAGWVDCRADNTVSSSADDVGFLAALVTRVRGEYGLSSADMFMAGGSNGAQMTHAFAFHHADLVGAVATASGSLPETPLPGPCTTGSGRPLPILILHGTADTQMPWGGGCVANLGGACNRGRVISAEATRDRWLEINGLTEVTPVKSVIEVSSTDAGPAVRWDYAGASPLQWWQLEGAGHTTPSQTVLSTPNPVTGTQNRDIEFAEVAWSFFAARLAADGRTISVPDGQTLTQSQAGHPLISGAGDVRKVGGGTLLLNAANSYTGPTSISAGGLLLTIPSALGSSLAIEVAAAALLDVRPLGGGLSIRSGQTLGGDGTVAGSVTFGQGSTLSPGMLEAATRMGSPTTLGEPVPVPEPGTLGLFGTAIGLLTVGLRRAGQGSRAAVLVWALIIVGAFGSSGQAQSRFDFSPVTDPITQYLASRPAIPGAGLLIADFEGGIRSSVGDIAAYLRMIGNQGLFAGQRILPAEAVQVMLSDQTGGGTVILDAANSHSGATAIEQGIMSITAATAISSSALVRLADNAGLDVRSISAGYTVPAGQTLAGSGTVWGSVTFSTGATLSPGMIRKEPDWDMRAAADRLGSLQPLMVPEPATLGLLGAGLGSLGFWVLRRGRRSSTVPAPQEVLPWQLHRALRVGTHSSQPPDDGSVRCSSSPPSPRGPFAPPRIRSADRPPAPCRAIPR